MLFLLVLKKHSLFGFGFSLFTFRVTTVDWNVRLSNHFCSFWNISATFGWITVTFHCIHGAQRVDPQDFYNLLTFLLAPPSSRIVINSSFHSLIDIHRWLILCQHFFRKPFTKSFCNQGSWIGREALCCRTTLDMWVTRSHIWKTTVWAAAWPRLGLRALLSEVGTRTQIYPADLPVTSSLSNL